MIPDPFKGLKIKDRILLTFLGTLALGEKVLDILDEIPTPRDVARALYTSAPKASRSSLNETSIQRTFIRVLSEKLLEKEETERGKRYKISDQGFNYLYKRYPLLRLNNREFDGHFRFVIYDIEETDRKFRHKMRSGLKSLGFKMIQKSVWVSPYSWENDVENFFKTLKLDGQAFILKAALPKDKTEELLTTHFENLLETYKKRK